ncbi:hypothetical protein AUC43_16700 [Hymenobacter sedentarius]|uniref:STAS/SEC14 domain-containing protein n=1 Tax=Hymenobacter sedentarius TaxID=1411621 RepID=A0A0U4ASZ0_9BACT|nr:hypothetical protein [Hymenobacter sedentarius]ALW86576.1 hypothetical protein AUC43_16700 [Hymenobacter sedentarius]
MVQRTLNSDPYLTLTYDPDHDWLYADWHGQVDSEDVMTGSVNLLNALRRAQCAKVLNNNTNLSGLWADAAIWGAEELLPKLYEAGCRYFAWVYSPETYSRLSTEIIIEHTRAGIVIRTFDDLDAAGTWLDQVQPAPQFEAHTQA